MNIGLEILIALIAGTLNGMFALMFLKSYVKWRFTDIYVKQFHIEVVK